MGLRLVSATRSTCRIPRTRPPWTNERGERESDSLDTEGAHHVLSKRLAGGKLLPVALFTWGITISSCNGKRSADMNRETKTDAILQSLSVLYKERQPR